MIDIVQLSFSFKRHSKPCISQPSRGIFPALLLFLLDPQQTEWQGTQKILSYPADMKTWEVGYKITFGYFSYSLLKRCPNFLYEIGNRLPFPCPCTLHV